VFSFDVASIERNLAEGLEAGDCSPVSVDPRADRLVAHGWSFSSRNASGLTGKAYRMESFCMLSGLRMLDCLSSRVFSTVERTPTAPGTHPGRPIQYEESAS
jgi:hypothetical protein